jgi:hypothetical protein
MQLGTSGAGSALGLDTCITVTCRVGAPDAASGTHTTLQQCSARQEFPDAGAGAGLGGGGVAAGPRWDAMSPVKWASEMLPAESVEYIAAPTTQAVLVQS